MLHGFFVLLLGQLAGEGIVRAAALPIPGPVVGIALLLAWLAFREGKTSAIDRGVENASQGLLKNFGLLFVPAGTGIVAQADVFLSYGSAVVAALVLSTLLTLAVTATIFQMTARLVARSRGDA